MIFSSKNTVESAELKVGVEPARLGGRFLATASLTAMAVMMSTAAQAQVQVAVVAVPAQSGIPAGCTPDPVAAGGTLTCTGTITERLDTNVDDLTVVIGTAAAPATVTTSGGGSAAISVDNVQGIDITVAAGSTVTGGEGIYADNNGSGSVTLTIDGEVTGTNSYGIYAENAGDNLTITATAAISGQYAGIYAENDGTGATTITTAAVTGGEGDAIDVETEGSGLTIVTNGNIQGSFGIDADVDEGATGGASITTNGTVTGTYGGIDLNHEGSGVGAVVITANDSVTGTNDSGIEVDFGDYGTTSATVSVGDVMGGEYSYGIDVTGGENSTNISVTSTGAVTAGRGGISVANYGTGTTTIEAADVTATNAGSGNVLVGGEFGYGAVRKLSFGGENGSVGINAYGGYNSGDLAVTVTGTVSGGDAAILVQNIGQGLTTVNAVNAIATNNYGAAIDVIHGQSRRVVSPYGGLVPVKNEPSVLQNGSNPSAHNVSVTSTGAATGGAAGIRVSNRDIGTTTVTAVDSTGVGTSSRTRNYGGYSGRPVQSLTFENSFGAGISVYGGEASGDLSVTSTGTAMGGEAGITVFNNGTGTTTIVAADSTAIGTSEYGRFNSALNAFEVESSATGTGISAYGGENSGDLTLTSTGTASGGRAGIAISNSGQGNTTVNAVDSTGTGGNYGTGIDVSNRNYSGNNGNSRSISVSSTGTATGTYTGISVRGYGLGDVTVEAVDSIGANDYGYGNGIYVSNRISRFSNQGANTGDIIISSTGTATGGYTGISTSNSGTGNIVVNAVDSIGSNSYGAGIRAYSTSTYISGSGTTDPSGDISITSTGNSEGGRYGITASNRGSGTITINAVNASADASRSYSSGGEGGETTLVVRNSGVAVNANGGENGGNISINTTGVVDGSLTGIRALTSGSASTTIDISGSVSGGENGVLTETLAGTNVILREGGSITGPVAIDTEERFRNSLVLVAISGPNDGPADVLDIAGAVNGNISTNDGIDTVTLASTGSINGTTFLGDGDDIFNHEGGGFAAINGGENSDTFNANAGGLTLVSSGTSNAVTLFEVFNLNNGVTSFAGTHSGIDAVNIASAGGLNLASGASLSGTVTNSGTLDIAENAVGVATLLGDFVQDGTGSASFDRISETEADLLNVAGDVTLGGTLNLNQSDVFLETVTLIDGGEGLSGSFDTINGLADGAFITQAVEIDTANADVNLVTTVLAEDDPTIVAALSPNQGGVIGSLSDGLRNDNLEPELDSLARKIGVLSSAGDVARVTEELSPEVASVGLQTVQSRHANFANNLINHGLRAQGAGVTQTASLFPSAGIRKSEGPRFWLNTGFVSVEQDATANTVDFETDGYEFALGVSNIDAGAFSLGFSVGYSEFDTDTSTEAFGGAGSDEIETELLLLGVHSRFDISGSAGGLDAHIDVAATYADGEHEFTQNIDAAPIDTAITQRGETDVSHLGGLLRLTLDGLGGQEWAIKPHVKAGVDNYDQDAFTLGTGATQLDVSGIDNTRYSLGYGADVKHAFGGTAYGRLGASGTHFFGDTEGEIISSFSGAADSGFSTAGAEVENQYVIEGGIGNTFGGWTVDVSGFGQFGDLEGYGGNLNFSTQF